MELCLKVDFRSCLSYAPIGSRYVLDLIGFILSTKSEGYDHSLKPPVRRVSLLLRQRVVPKWSHSG